MRQKFEAEDPAEQGKAGGQVDRSQGAARAISVSYFQPPTHYLKCSSYGLVVHRPWAFVERFEVVQEHHEK